MPIVKPFKAMFYNFALPIDKIVAPPYDVISESERDELYKMHEFNVVRLILNRDPDPYESARALLNKWLNEKILVESDVEAIYLYEQEFEHDWKKLTRKGIIGILQIEEFGKGNIYPHEKTLPKPKEDRFKLLNATRAQFDHIFAIYSDPELKIEKLLEEISTELIYDFEFQDVRQKLYKISNVEVISFIQHFFKDKKIFIADGHHRYETGLNFMKIMMANNPNHSGEESYNFILTYLTNMDSEAMVIMPTHRLIHGVKNFALDKFLKALEPTFETIKVQNGDELLKKIKLFGKWNFGLITCDNFYLLRLRDRSNLDFSREMPEPVANLDVTILHEVILKVLSRFAGDFQVSYTHSYKTAEEKIKNGEAELAFILNPPSVYEVKEVSLSGATMPQKSTYFYPKLLSGIVMRKL